MLDVKRSLAAQGAIAYTMMVNSVIRNSHLIHNTQSIPPTSMKAGVKQYRTTHWLNFYTGGGGGAGGGAGGGGNKDSFSSK